MEVSDLPDLFIFISHKLTDNQMKEAKDKFNIQNFIYMSENLQKKWSGIPADLYSLKEYLKPFRKFLVKNSVKGDYILIQGDPGAVYYLVQYVKSIDLTPIYSTSNRKVKETSNGIAIKSIRYFKHIQFRKYEDF